MYRLPSRKKTRKETQKPNIIPILDAVFIFIFFLLMSASFTKIYEISSDVPIVSDKEPPKSKKKPLALTVKIYANSIDLYTGVPSRRVTKIKKISGEYDYNTLHSYLIGLKQKHLDEKTAILEPIVDINYEELIKIMDAIRTIENTDEPIYSKDKDGIDIKLKDLFSNIVFGNIQS